MTIRRAPRPTSNFYVLNKSISEDRRLSWGARGMLVFLLGKPDHWEVSTQALVNETSESARGSGRDGVRAILGELIAAGYMKRVLARDSGGKVDGYDYLVSEEPAEEASPGAGSQATAEPGPEKPATEKPAPEKPATAKPAPAIPPQARTDKKEEMKKKQELTLPSWIPVAQWDGYLEMRKRMKKPMTGRALGLAVASLEELMRSGEDPGQVLDQSTMNSWIGLYPVKRAAVDATVMPQRMSASGVATAANARSLAERIFGDGHEQD